MVIPSSMILVLFWMPTVNTHFVAESVSQRLRFIAMYTAKKPLMKLSDKQKSQSAADIMHYLCTDKTYGYGINEKKLDKTMILKLVNVRYAMSLNSYQKYISTTIASDVSDQTVADIMENSDSLQGVNIEEEPYADIQTVNVFQM